MKQKNLFAFVFMFLFLVGTISQVSAFMPRDTHKIIHNTALADQYSSDWYAKCMKYPDLCYTGNVLTDVSVIWYWTEGYKYAVTHSPNFCRALIESAGDDPSSGATADEEYACAIGGCMHQPADIASHSIKDGKSGLVPTTIKNSFLVNNIIHVFAEQKVDTWVVNNYPGIEDTAETQLTNYAKCVPLFKRVMLGQEQYSDVTDDELNTLFDKFITEVQNSKTGYDPAFKNKSFMVNFKSLPFSIIAMYLLIMAYFIMVVALLAVKIVKREAKVRHYITIIIFAPIVAILIYVLIANATGGAFQAILNIATPISKIVPIGNSPEYYVNMGIENTKQFLNQGPQWLTNTEASGFTALAQADQGVMWMDYLIIAVLLIGLILWTYYIFKSNKIKAQETFAI